MSSMGTLAVVTLTLLCLVPATLSSQATDWTHFHTQDLRWLQS